MSWPLATGTDEAKSLPRPVHPAAVLGEAAASRRVLIECGGGIPLRIPDPTLIAPIFTTDREPLRSETRGLASREPRKKQGPHRLPSSGLVDSVGMARGSGGSRACPRDSVVSMRTTGERVCQR